MFLLWFMVFAIEPSNGMLYVDNVILMAVLVANQDHRNQFLISLLWVSTVNNVFSGREAAH